MPNGFEVQFFRDQGYLVLSEVLDATSLAELRVSADAELVQAHERRGEWDLLEKNEVKPGQMAAVFRLSRVMARHPAFQSVAQDPRVAEYVRALVASDAEVCVNRHNMMVVKAPYEGRQVDWHQDGVNWGHARMVSFMVFLDDASTENGCLEIVPGAHKFGLLPTVKTSVGEGMDISDTRQAALVRQAVPLCVPAGTGLFFHSCLPHFSKANRSAHFRRNLTFAYVSAADKAISSSRMAPLETLPLLATAPRIPDEICVGKA